MREMVHEEIFNYFLQVAEDGRIPFDVAVPPTQPARRSTGSRPGRSNGSTGPMPGSKIWAFEAHTSPFERLQA